MQFCVLAALVFLNYLDRAHPETYVDPSLHRNFVSLVAEVQGYFMANSMVVVNGYDDETGIYTTKLMVHLMRDFSERLVALAVLKYSDLQRYYRSYSTYKIRPLIVVILRTAADVDEFRLVTGTYNMSDALWLVFFMGESLFELCRRPPGNYFNLAFDTEMLVKCRGDETLREWYAIDQNRTKIYQFATWERARLRLDLVTRKSLYERRHNLYGSALRLGIVKDSPFVMMENGVLGGFFPLVLYELSNYINFRINVTYEEVHYGSYNEATDSWTGVIGRLTRNEIDIGLDEFTMTEKRLDAVDFSLPILQLEHQVFMRRLEKSNLYWWGYFRVYAAEVWFAMHLTAVLASYVITAIQQMTGDRPFSHRNLLENYFNIWGICWQQGLPVFPRKMALRIAYLSILVKAVVLYAIYSACLISYLTVSGPNVPFASLADFADDGSYTLITFQHGAQYELLMTSRDSVIQKIAKRIPSAVYLPETMADGFKQSCYQKMAFYSTGLIKSQINRFAPCELASMTTGGIDSVAITLPKRSPYTRIINYHLQKFREVGVMQRLMAQLELKPNPPPNEHNAVSIEEIAIMLTILLIGCSTSIVFLMLEMILHSRSSARGSSAGSSLAGSGSAGSSSDTVLIDFEYIK